MSSNAFVDRKVMKTNFILIGAFIAILLVAFIPTTAANSTIEVVNLSNDSYNYTYQQLTEMPQTNVDAELFCYGNLVSSGGWSGVQLNYLLAQTNITSEVMSIQFTASDSYKVTIPIQLAVAPDTILAFEKVGEQLTGLRLVLPGVNGAAWINRIVSINMGSTVVEAPEAASGLGALGNPLNNILENRQTTPVTSFVRNNTTTTPKPTPENSSINQIVPPSNTSESKQTPQPQIEINQSMSLDGGTIALIATVFAAVSAIAAILACKNKMKLKRITSHN